VVFLVEPRAKEKTARALEATGAQVLDAKVAPKGVQVS
jgi:hypothetical protein